MSSMKSSMNKWLGKPDISHMGQACLMCESALEQELLPLGRPPMVRPEFTTPAVITLPQAFFRPYRGYKPYTRTDTVEYLQEIGFLQPDETIQQAQADKIVEELPEAKPVKLGTLESGDRFIATGNPDERVYELLRRQGTHMIIKSIKSLSIEEAPIGTEVIKVGHRTGATTICDGMPRETREAMIEASEDGYNHYETLKVKDAAAIEVHAPIEMGAVITDDYTLGDIKSGTRDKVDIPRIGSGLLGTFHTHPTGGGAQLGPVPGDFDIVDMLQHNDKLQCICATGPDSTKCKCYTPHEPQFTNMRQELNNLLLEITKYNKMVNSRYGLRGKSLRKFLTRIVGTTEPYISSRLPYEVQTGPAFAVRGQVTRPLTTRLVYGNQPISLEQKRETYQAWRGAEEYAKKLEADYSTYQAKITDLINQISELTMSDKSIRIAADESGQYITIYLLDRVHSPTNIQAIRDKVGAHEAVYTFKPIKSVSFYYGNSKRHQDIATELNQVNAEINTLSDGIKTLLKEETSVNYVPDPDNPLKQQTVYTKPETTAKLSESNELIRDLYGKRADLFFQEISSRPVLQILSPEMTLIVVNDAIPLASNEAAQDIIPIPKTEAIALIDKRADEINAQEKGRVTSIASLQRQINILVGELKSFPVEIHGVKELRQYRSGGRAQVFRDIKTDATKSATERINASIELDDLLIQASKLRKQLLEEKRLLKAGRYTDIMAETRDYSPDIENQAQEIINLSQKIDDLQPVSNKKRIAAQEARETADELRTEVKALAKIRTTEYNDALHTIHEGQTLEAKRQAFIGKLKDYETQARLPEDEMNGLNNRIFNACRLVWEEPDTIPISDLATVREMAEAFVGHKVTPEEALASKE